MSRNAAHEQGKLIIFISHLPKSFFANGGAHCAGP